MLDFSDESGDLALLDVEAVTGFALATQNEPVNQVLGRFYDFWRAEDVEGEEGEEAHSTFIEVGSCHARRCPHATSRQPHSTCALRVAAGERV